MKLSFLKAVPCAAKLVIDLVSALRDLHVTKEELDKLLGDLAELTEIIQSL